MDAELEAWLSDTVLPDFGPQVAYDEVARNFFAGVFAQRGALTGEPLWSVAVTHQYELAKDAVLAINADITATVTDRELRVSPVLSGFVVRISCEGQFSSHDGGRMLSFGPTQALLEVATTVQDLITEQCWIVWPECKQHGRGLMAEPGGGPAAVPTWTCWTGPHPIAPIGALGPVAPTVAAG